MRWDACGSEGTPPGDCALQGHPFPSFLSTAVTVCVLTQQRRCPEDLFAGGCIEAAKGGGGVAQLEERGQAG